MLFGILKQLFRAGPSTKHRAQEGRAANPRSSVPAPSEAEAACRRTLELLPNLAEAHNNLGVILKNSKRPAEAEAAFRRSIALKGDNALAFYNLAAVLAETNRPWAAETAYRNALKVLPNFAEAHNNLGVVLKNSERLAEAEAAFRRALESKPDFTDARKNLAIVLAEGKRLADAEAECRRELVTTPDAAAVHNRLGMLLKERRRLAEAEVVFRRAIGLEADNADAHYNLGGVLAANRPWEAEAAYRSALQLRPVWAEAHNDLGLVLAATHRPREAEAAYRSALQLQPEFADAYNNLGVLLAQTDRPLQAEAAFRRATTLKPGYEAAQSNLDLVVKEIQRLSVTEASCRRAVEATPERAASHYKLGLTLMALGKLDDAVVSFKRVLAIEPDNADAHNHLGTALMRQGQIEPAVACYLQAVSVKPDFAKAMTNLGTACLIKKDVDQAMTWNKAALAIEPSQLEANQNMALILRGMGRGEEAQRHLDRASPRQTMYVEYAVNPTRTVLLLWTKKTGNIPTIELLLPATINTRVNWVIESADDDQTDRLPDYDLVFNAMGDPDLIGDSFGPVSRFAAACAKPLLNHPDRVTRTARHNLPALLEGIDNIVVPAVWRFAASSDWEESIADQLPLLIRPVESHGGAGLKLARTLAELARCRASQSGPVFVCPFVDFASADSWFRKYRMIFVDRKPYPYHLAISPTWLVHYATAEMEPNPWKLEEEKVFLQDPEAALGHVGMRAIEAIAARIDLDYSGIDFSVMEDKRILVFEANPMMLVHPETIGGPIEHKNPYVFKIQEQFEQMLQRRLGR
jgi:Flp pilus assembly protein TadD